MRLFTSGKLNFCPYCQAPKMFLDKKQKYYHCGKCKNNIAIPSEEEVPVNRKWTMDYDIKLKKWYYLDKRGNRCPL